MQPRGQQQILDVIERDLCTTDPELVMLFAALLPDRRAPQERASRLGRWAVLALVLATVAGGLIIVLLGG